MKMPTRTQKTSKKNSHAQSCAISAIHAMRGGDGCGAERKQNQENIGKPVCIQIFPEVSFLSPYNQHFRMPSNIEDSKSDIVYIPNHFSFVQ